MWYPAAEKKPIAHNFTKGGNNPDVLIVHIMVGFIGPTDAIFHRQGTNASAHFGVGRDGHVIQWVSTKDQAWHAFGANHRSIGVEHEGFPNRPLTWKQTRATAQIYAWLHEVHGIPLWMNKRIDGSGLAWHRKYHEWNLDNHSCPGSLIIAQCPTILRKAKRFAKKK